MKQKLQRIWSPEPMKQSSLEIYPPQVDKRRISIFPIPINHGNSKRRRNFQQKVNSFHKDSCDEKHAQDDENSMSSKNIMQLNGKEILQNYNCSKMEFGKPSSMAFIDGNPRPFSSSSDVYSVMMNYSKNKDSNFAKRGNSVQIHKQVKSDIVKLMKDYYCKGSNDKSNRSPKAKVGNRTLLQHKNIYKSFVFQSLLLPKLKQTPNEEMSLTNEEYIQQLMTLMNDDNFLSDLNSQLKHKEPEEQKMQDLDEFSDILSDTGFFNRSRGKDKMFATHIYGQPTIKLERTFSIDQKCLEEETKIIAPQVKLRPKRNKISTRIVTSKFQETFTMKSKSSKLKLKGLVSPVPNNADIDFTIKYSNVKSFRGRQDNSIVNEETNLSHSESQLDKQ